MTDAFLPHQELDGKILILQLFKIGFQLMTQHASCTNVLELFLGMNLYH